MLGLDVACSVLCDIIKVVKLWTWKGPLYSLLVLLYLVPRYAFMAWCSVKAQGQLYLLPLLSFDAHSNVLHKSYGSQPFKFLLYRNI
jgi:hypothetical protein